MVPVVSLYSIHGTDRSEQISGFTFWGVKPDICFQINTNQYFIIYNKRHVMSIHGVGDKSASVVSIKDCKVSCYFDTSHMSTPLPVTSAFDTVMDFPV